MPSITLDGSGGGFDDEARPCSARAVARAQERGTGKSLGPADLLGASSIRHVENFAISERPVLYRLPIAAGLVVLAAWRNRPAALPVIVCFALPAIWLGSLVLLAAIPRVVGQWQATPIGGRAIRLRASRPIASMR